MKIFYGISDIPAIKNPVITIGTFDGVHKGHKEIIKQLRKQAIDRQGESVVITFAEHPRHIFRTQDNVFLLNDQDEKIQLLKKEGVENLIIIEYSSDFFAQSASEYIENFLAKKIKPVCIIIGYDHRFGKGRAGDFPMLVRYGQKYHFEVKEIDAQVVHSVTVSSTKIRKALGLGDVSKANELLGYRYFFTGKVMPGNKRGRTIGFPTANLQIQNELKLVPANGVYAVYAYLEKDPNIRLKGMMNIGYRPTVDGGTKTIEVHIFNFNKDIYGSLLTVELVAYLRAEQKFSGLEALKHQLEQDKRQATQILEA